MPFRNLLAICLLTALHCAGFSGNAHAGTFTNGDFITYGNFDWGDNPGAGTLLQDDYDTVYASTFGALEVGIPGAGGFAMIFTGGSEVQTYLPASGPAGPLDSDLVDPSSSASGSFGGEVTALQLNIDFSDAGLLLGNLGFRFGDLVLTNYTDLTQLNGLTLRQISAIANTLLGGGSSGSYTIDNLFPILASLNASFGDGIDSSFAEEHLVIVQVPPVMQAVNRSGSTITFTWSTTPRSMYQVQFITDLTRTNWISLGSAIQATNLTWTASETMTNSQGFYRIELLPPSRATPPTNGGFITYGQADWADNPIADVLLQANYDTVYASTFGALEVGIPGAGGFSMVFSGTLELLDYLPASGPTGPLDSDLVDPSTSASGAFGGDVTALKLNIDFSDAGLLPGNPNPGIHFGDLHLRNFSGGQLRSLNVLTVRQFAGGMNNLLGGGTFFIPTRNFTYHTSDIPALDAIIQSINSSYFGGTASAFATNNLAVPQVP